jgi:hypothetical protein
VIVQIVAPNRLLKFGALFAWSPSGPFRTKLAAAHASQFIVRRLIVALLVAATVMTLAFVLTRLSGDLAVSIAGPERDGRPISRLVRKAYGLDRPVLTSQFFDWVGRAVTGDLGEQLLLPGARLDA